MVRKRDGELVVSRLKGLRRELGRQRSISKNLLGAGGYTALSLPSFQFEITPRCSVI